MKAGDVVSDRFEIAARAGAGGMGVVYRARDRVSDTWVALKVLHGQGGDGAERFAREAYVLSELRHPAIVGYVAHGVTSEGDGYIAMQWLEGESLSQRLARGPLPFGDAVALLERIADAVEVAHARGIIHRDLKPANLFLLDGDLGRPMVLDFGIARMLAAGNTLTATGSMLGTPGYMAPEQAHGDKQMDARVDVYALGCVLFKCLAGRAPFEGEDPISVLLKVVTEPAPRVASHCRGVPPALDYLIARMLARSPADRPPSAAAVARELAAIAAAPYAESLEPTAVTAALPRHEAVAPTFAGTAVTAPGQPATLPTTAESKSRTRRMIMGVALGVVASAIAVVAFNRLRADASPAARGSCLGERCLPIAAKDLSRVDPLDLLPQTMAMARDTDRGADLMAISLIAMPHDGLIDVVDGQSTLAFSIMQTGPKEARPLMTISAAHGRLELVRVPTTVGAPPLRDPKCSFRALWSAAVAGGFPHDRKVGFQYVMSPNAPLTAMVSVSTMDAPFIARMFNGETCAPL